MYLQTLTLQTPAVIKGKLLLTRYEHLWEVQYGENDMEKFVKLLILSMPP